MTTGRRRGTLPGRAGEMAASIRSTARSAGLTPADTDRVLTAFELAMAPRMLGPTDDHHPASLHPRSSILILIRDTDCSSCDTLSLAALIESEDLPLSAPDAEVSRAVGAALADRRRACPHPGTPKLLERLVELPESARLAALAERLDHLRHYHLRDDLEPIWRARYDEVIAAWAPFARHVHPVLARRYDHWIRSFGRRLPSPA